MWTPPWPSIEPSTYVRARHAEYGTGADAKLLAGIMGHNLCVDIFGGPSDEEAAAGLTPHGEASVARYEIDVTGQAISMRAVLPLAALRVERRLELRDRAVENPRERREPDRAAIDRSAGPQHVTLGPPFLEKGRHRVPRLGDAVEGVRARVRCRRLPCSPAPRSTGRSRHALDGGTADLRRFTDAAASSAYTAHLMDAAREDAFFVAFSPKARLAFGYVWKRRDFPWLGIWEENHSRTHAPWNGATLTCGMEFGVSPMPESRREMIDRGRLFDVPTYRWIPAKSRVEVEYWAIIRDADAVPEILERP